jgi:hypothetical protein
MSKTPNQVFVLDISKKPLTPCLPVIARKLLNAGKAKVFRLYPFTIILKKSVNDPPKPIEIRIDPGSKTTGIALVQETQVIWGAELSIGVKLSNLDLKPVGPSDAATVTVKLVIVSHDS